MQYFLYPTDSRPPLLTTRPIDSAGPRIGFGTESEAVDHACRLLAQRKFVAAIERPDGTLIGPHEIAERCNPFASMNRVG